MAMTSAWLRPRIPSGQRSLPYAEPTVLRPGKKPSIELGLMPSSKLRRPENIFFPPAIRAPGLAPNQKEVAPSVTKLAEDAQLQNPPPPSQQEQAKEPEVPQGTSSDKVAKAPQLGAASQSFEQALALTTLPVGGAFKEKDKEVPPKATDKAPKAKLQIKLKP